MSCGTRLLRLLRLLRFPALSVTITHWGLLCWCEIPSALQARCILAVASLPEDTRIMHLARELYDGEFWKAPESAGVLSYDRVAAVLSSHVDRPAEKAAIGAELGLDFEIAQNGRLSGRIAVIPDFHSVDDSLRAALSLDQAPVAFERPERKCGAATGGHEYCAQQHDEHFALHGYLPRSRTWVESTGSGRLFAYRGIVMNTLFGSSVS